MYLIDVCIFELCIFVVQGSDVVVYLYSFICRDLLKQFTTMELMRWTSLVDDYKKELRDGSPDSPATDVFSYSEEGEKRWKDLKNRVVEHVSWRTYSLFPTSGPVWFGPEKFGTWSLLREMLFHHWAKHMRACRKCWFFFFFLKEKLTHIFVLLKKAVFILKKKHV